MPHVMLQVLYDDGVWYPGAVCSYTETTHKFRFKLTEVCPVCCCRREGEGEGEGEGGAAADAYRGTRSCVCIPLLSPLLGA